MIHSEPGRHPVEATLGGRATIVSAGVREGFSGAALLARTITNAPPNELRIRGLPS